MTPQEIRGQLAAYNKIQSQLKVLKNKAATVKKTILENCFTQQSPDQEGTEKLELVDCIVKRNCKLTRTVTADEETIAEAAAQISDPELMDKVLPVKRSFSKTAYKELSAEDKKIVDTLYETKIASPDLTVEGDFS